jgi:uncharacterized membrane protein YtjA (UPF0391 family)
MKYLFIGLYNIIRFVPYGIIQTFLILWHLDLKHCATIGEFYDGAFRKVEDIGMLQWTVIFLVAAIIACIFGFGGIGGPGSDAAKILFFIFLVLFVLSLIAGGFRRVD